MVYTKTYIFTYFYSQYLVLYTMVSRNSTSSSSRSMNRNCCSTEQTFSPGLLLAVVLFRRHSLAWHDEYIHSGRMRYDTAAFSTDRTIRVRTVPKAKHHPSWSFLSWRVALPNSLH